MGTDNFVPEVQDWAYILRSAVDFEVCSQASMFVGNSWSGFSQQIAKRMAAAGRPSFIYNVDFSDTTNLTKSKSEFSVRERTDGGLLFEPHDATMPPAHDDTLLTN